MREKKLRAAVVGVGYIGKFHAEKFAAMPDVELVGVVDPDEDQARRTAAAHRTAAFSGHRDLFGKVDAVSIASPTPTHFAVARDFLEADVDVLIEKPVTVTLEEADRLIDLAESRGLLIQVGQLERFNSVVRPLKDLVVRPLFIESHRVHTFKNRCTDVSVVLDLMIHDLDLALSLVNDEVSQVHAAGAAVVSDHVDIANARLEFAGGCIANITASRISMKNERKLRIFQRDSYVSVDMGNREVTTVTPAEGGLGDGPIPRMTIRTDRLESGDALADELTSFVRAVRRRTPPEVTGRMGRDALQVALSVMEQIQAAARKALGTSMN